jgi:hypothetical protein
MDSVRYNKLLNYAAYLEKHGNQFEKEGDEVEAIPTYIKMVDVLLLLAEVAPSYPDWQKFTDKAESYQKRMKVLISKASAKVNSLPPSPTSRKSEPVVAAPQIAQK